MLAGLFLIFDRTIPPLFQFIGRFLSICFILFKLLGGRRLIKYIKRHFTFQFDALFFEQAALFF